jgi:hypothetical protein
VPRSIGKPWTAGSRRLSDHYHTCTDAKCTFIIIRNSFGCRHWRDSRCSLAAVPVLSTRGCLCSNPPSDPPCSPRRPHHIRHHPSQQSQRHRSKRIRIAASVRIVPFHPALAGWYVLQLVAIPLRLAHGMRCVSRRAPRRTMIGGTGRQCHSGRKGAHGVHRHPDPIACNPYYPLDQHRSLAFRRPQRHHITPLVIVPPCPQPVDEDVVQEEWRALRVLCLVQRRLHRRPRNLGHSTDALSPGRGAGCEALGRRHGWRGRQQGGAAQQQHHWVVAELGGRTSPGET